MTPNRMKLMGPECRTVLVTVLVLQQRQQRRSSQMRRCPTCSCIAGVSHARPIQEGGCQVQRRHNHLRSVPNPLASAAWRGDDQRFVLTDFEQIGFGRREGNTIVRKENNQRGIQHCCTCQFVQNDPLELILGVLSSVTRA